MKLRGSAGEAVELVARPGRRLVASHPRLRSALARVRAKLPRPRPAGALEQVIFEFAHAYPKAVFVQVGANDGRYMDPLRQEIVARRWRGVMVEPVPYVFASLRENYGSNRRVALENAALSEEDGTRELYYLAQAEPGAPPLPDWYDKLGSFHREVIEKHRPAIRDFDSRLRTLEVPCLTFDTLCRKHGLTSLDLIQTDTEGHDFEILKLVDFDRLRPRIVMYEHLHFDDATRSACSEHLRRHGYEELRDVVNTVCLRTADLTRRDRSLSRLWSRLNAGGADSERLR